jgi:hypothetical protein
LDQYLAHPGWTFKLIAGMALIPIGSTWQWHLTRRKNQEE